MMMVAFHLLNKTRVYEFPFWAGVLALGWFYPMAIGGYSNVGTYPDSAYANGMLFSTLCTLALWAGYGKAVMAVPIKISWLNALFNEKRLMLIGAIFVVGGMFFYWKLQSLPAEMLARSQWSGAAVKYLFLANIFKFGFIALWIVYLWQDRLVVPKLLVFLVPSLLLLLSAAVLDGRRGEMMNVFAYIFIPLWFVRRIIVPRLMLGAGLVAGLIFINSIGIYRSIMKHTELSVTDRIEMASKEDYTSASKTLIKEGGGDFDNYIYMRQVTAEDFRFDGGLKHWNEFVGNYVPAQLVGRGVKQSLKIPLKYNSIEVARERYGHVFHLGGVATGYYDAFASFGWLGFVKFWMVGWLMGTVYRHGIKGGFLGIFLYVYMLNPAMHSISHGTNKILVQMWVYFFLLAYPVLSLARVKMRPSSGG